MKTSAKGLYAIALHEGIVPAPYIDAVGVWTFGIGHAETSGLEPNPRHMPRGMPADQDAAIRQSFELFRAKIGQYEAAVKRAVKVPLEQHEFDALVSFQFNTGAIAKASATKSLNAGDKQDAARRLGLYNKGRVNGQLQVLPGLVRRREEEQAMFLRGVYPSGPIPIYTVSDTGKLGRMISRMPQADAMRLLSGDRPNTVAQRPQTQAPAPRPAQRPSGLAAIITAIFKALGLGKGGPA